MNTICTMKSKCSLTMRYTSMALTAALLVWFYCVQPGFSSHSAVGWLVSSWNSETDYEHAWMVPLFSAAMIYQARSKLAALPRTETVSWIPFLFLASGALLYVAGYRTMQGRVVIGALPFLLTGCMWFFLGRRAAWLCAFPFFFLWMAIPLPGFQQATVGMQLMATQAAHWGASLFGVQTVVEGTNIASATGNWDAYSIAGGCSGMRSLMALLMIAVAWAYMSPLSWWKKLILAGSAIPLAILGNAFRVTSIFVFAEYVDPSFASKTWHDWSGLLFFFPATLIGLTLLYSVLAGEIPFLKKKRTVVLRSNGPKERSAQ